VPILSTTYKESKPSSSRRDHYYRLPAELVATRRKRLRPCAFNPLIGTFFRDGPPKLRWPGATERIRIVTESDLRRRLQRVSTRDKETLEKFREGESLSTAFGKSFEDVRHQAAADRLKLGEHFIRVANRMSNASRHDWRAVIGRYYYAMYHSMRAVSFYSHGGDDHQAHAKLPQMIPNDFPSRTLRANELRDARTQRNEADYDLFPSGSPHFRRNAIALAPTAAQFVLECRVYMKQKGCKFV
jgi:uncharacterized protein (UPF0332 family)